MFNNRKKFVEAERKKLARAELAQDGNSHASSLTIIGQHCLNCINETKPPPTAKTAVLSPQDRMAPSIPKNWREQTLKTRRRRYRGSAEGGGFPSNHITNPYSSSSLETLPKAIDEGIKKIKLQLPQIFDITKSAESATEIRQLFSHLVDTVHNDITQAEGEDTTDNNPVWVYNRAYKKKLLKKYGKNKSHRKKTKNENVEDKYVETSWTSFCVLQEDKLIHNRQSHDKTKLEMDTISTDSSLIIPALTMQNMMTPFSHLTDENSAGSNFDVNQNIVISSKTEISDEFRYPAPDNVIHQPPNNTCHNSGSATQSSNTSMQFSPSAEQRACVSSKLISDFPLNIHSHNKIAEIQSKPDFSSSLNGKRLKSCHHYLNDELTQCSQIGNSSGQLVIPHNSRTLLESTNTNIFPSDQCSKIWRETAFKLLPIKRNVMTAKESVSQSEAAHQVVPKALKTDPILTESEKLHSSATHNNVNDVSITQNREHELKYKKKNLNAKKMGGKAFKSGSKSEDHVSQQQRTKIIPAKTATSLPSLRNQHGADDERSSQQSAGREETDIRFIVEPKLRARNDNEKYGNILQEYKMFQNPRFKPHATDPCYFVMNCFNLCCPPAFTCGPRVNCCSPCQPQRCYWSFECTPSNHTTGCGNTVQRNPCANSSHNYSVQQNNSISSNGCCMNPCQQINTCSPVPTRRQTLPFLSPVHLTPSSCSSPRSPSRTPSRGFDSPVPFTRPSPPARPPHRPLPRPPAELPPQTVPVPIPIPYPVPCCPPPPCFMPPPFFFPYCPPPSQPPSFHPSSVTHRNLSHHSSILRGQPSSQFREMCCPLPPPPMSFCCPPFNFYPGIGGNNMNNPISHLPREPCCKMGETCKRAKKRATRRRCNRNSG